MSKKFRPATELPPVKVLPTGISNLDFATRIGGIALGSQVEIFGRESVGKSLLAYYMIAEAQRRGHKCAYIDLEGTFDAKWAKTTSRLSLANLDIARPHPGTDSVNTLEEAVKSNDYKLIIFDSLGGMVDDAEKDFASMRVGGTSKIITSMVTKISPFVHEGESVVVYINQARDSFNSYGVGAAAEEAPGGRAKKHMCSMRIHLRPGEPLNHKNEKIGFRVNAKIVKNKNGTPNKKAGWSVWNEPDPVHGNIGIDLIQDIIDTSINYGVISRAGAWYTHKLFGEKPVQGTERIYEFIAQNPGSYDVLREDVLNLAKELHEKDYND